MTEEEFDMFRDGFNISWDTWNRDPQPPTISLNLTQDEIELCKRYAKSRLLQERPDFEDKNTRSMKIYRDYIIRHLIEYYEERQADILKTK